MGQKINANALRLGVNKTWKSSWFADSKDLYAKNLHQDLAIKEEVKKAFKQSGLETVFIRRNGNKVEVEVAVAKPGVAIGRGGEGIENVKKDLTRRFQRPVDVKITEVKKADTSARIIARSIADGIERRQPPKLLMMSHKEKAISSGAKGIRIWISGRIGGNSQARTIKVSEGPVPLHTFRAHVDFAKEVAQTLDSGLLGVKVWIYYENKQEEGNK